MAKMYALANEKHRAALPTLQHFQSYMKLRSSWVACKQGKLLTALQLALPAVSSPAAWKLVIKSALSEQENDKQIAIRKFVLIDIWIFC